MVRSFMTLCYLYVLCCVIEPSGSQGPLGGPFALDIQLRTRTLDTPPADRRLSPKNARMLWEFSIQHEHKQPDDITQY